MSRTFRLHPRGAALLIVLATLIITMTAMTIITRAATTIRLQRQIQQSGVRADDLLHAADAPIQHWLKEHSDRTIAPAEARSPRFEVMDDGLIIDGQSCRIRITAFDQCGMVALEAVRNGSPLRLTLPPVPDVARMIDATDRQPTDPVNIPGLDWFTDLNDSEGVRVYPREEVTDQPALGELVATHSGKQQQINVNTAPLPLVKAAMQLAGRGGFEQVADARKSGKATIVGTQALPARGRTEFAPQIVTSSQSWSFRIDIRVGPLWRSWWAMYEVSSSKWKNVQRIAITE